MLLASEKGERRRRIADAVMPAVLPGSAAQKGALSALSAIQLVDDAERREVAVVDEALSAVHSAIRAGRTPTDQELGPTSQLVTVLQRSPNLRARVQAVSDLAERSSAEIARAAIAAIEAAINQNKGTKFTAAEFDKLQIASVLEKLPPGSRPTLAAIVA